VFSVLGAGIFITIWWTTIFAVLPFGIKSQGESGMVVPGSEPGAPTIFRLWRVVGITTAVSIIIWLVLFIGIDQQWIDLDRWGNVLLGTTN